MRRIHLPWRLSLALAVSLGLSGCFNPFDPLVAKNRVGASDPPPDPTRPELVVRLFEWCWDHRSIAEYEEIFTEDFLFQFAETDSSGNAFLGRVLTRIDEIETARHLFVGGGASPPANSISLQLDANLIPIQDTRPGKRDTTYHREISTSVVLRIDTDEEDFQVTGTARFFVVRGDSAVIPVELSQRFPPDAGRWWIERWEDETVGPGGSAFSVVRTRKGASASVPTGDLPPAATVRRSPAPASTAAGLVPVSWGYVKALFRPRDF